MSIRTLALLLAAATAEIGGTYLIWQGLREGKGPLVAVLGCGVLVGYGVIATLQRDPNFGRVLAAYGGVFVAGSIAWGAAVDGFKPDRQDLLGVMICLTGSMLILAPR